ncbi:MAG TPA: alpha/beta hydrolase [Pyrinomonadaceae bacterium]|nr:alpha/beta hydrolase [Pyrinomonadaceae bacterium]
MNPYKPTLFERLLSFGARNVLGRLPGSVQTLLAFLLTFRRRRVIKGKKLDPCLHLMISVSRLRNHYGLCEPDPVTARARFQKEVLIFQGPKTEVGEVRDLEIAGEGGGSLPARLYRPDTPEPEGGRRLLVFFHGGGFVIGDIETHDEPCRLLCKHADTVVLSVEYHLAPERKHPHAVEDVLAAFDAARARAAEFGASPRLVSVGGDSAGGNLSAVVAQQRRDDPPSAQLLIYPATDGSERSDSYESRKSYGEGLAITQADYEAFGHHYIEGSGVERNDPRISPLCATDFKGLPPALVVTAGFDLLHDDGEKYFENMKAAAADGAAAERDFKLLPFDTLTHGFLHMTGVCACARDAAIKIARRWRELLDSTGR